MDGDLTRRTRSRQRAMRSSDLMANEPEWETMDSGPHVPSLYRPKRRPGRGQEVEEALLGEDDAEDDGLPMVSSFLCSLKTFFHFLMQSNTILSNF